MLAFAGYIMRGRMQAMLVATVAAALSLLPFFTILNYLSGAVVGLVTLRKGGPEGLLILTGAALVMGLFSGFTPLPPLLSLLFATLVWLPVWALALVLRRTVSWSATISAAAAMGALLVAAAYMLFGDPAAWWREVLQNMQDQWAASGMTNAAASEAMWTLLKEASASLTGLFAAGLVMGNMVSLLLARWWQSLLYNPGGFRQEFHALRLGHAYAAISAGMAGAGAFAGGALADFAINVLFVMGTMYVLAGLGLIHSVVAITGAHTAWLVAVYVLLLLPKFGVGVAVAGFIDSWADFRGRLAVRLKPPPGD